MKTPRVLSLITLVILAQIALLGCGVKSKPLAPLKEPWISTGELEKDREKKNKQKRPLNPSDTRVEFSPNSNPSQTPIEEKKEK